MNEQQTVGARQQCHLSSRHLSIPATSLLATCLLETCLRETCLREICLLETCLSKTCLLATCLTSLVASHFYEQHPSSMRPSSSRQPRCSLALLLRTTPSLDATFLSAPTTLNHPFPMLPAGFTTLSDYYSFRHSIGKKIRATPA